MSGIPDQIEFTPNDGATYEFSVWEGRYRGGEPIAEIVKRPDSTTLRCLRSGCEHTVEEIGGIRGFDRVQREARRHQLDAHIDAMRAAV